MEEAYTMKQILKTLDYNELYQLSEINNASNKFQRILYMII